MAASGDLRAAATVVGFIEAGEGPGGACRDIVMGGLDATEAEVLCGSGSRVSDADILGHMGLGSRNRERSRLRGRYGAAEARRWVGGQL
jgi:hypothetical protein